MVRAYDVATGVLVWQAEFAEGFALSGAESLVVRGGRVFVGGFAYTEFSSDLFVRAHDLHTGLLLWQHRIMGGQSSINTLRGLDLDGVGVFAAGTVANRSGKNDFLVQTLDAGTGTLLWEDRVDKGGDADGAYGIAVQGGRVFAQGFGGRRCLNAASPPSDCDNVIRSYDTQTGALVWEKQPGLTGIDDYTFVPAVRARGKRLYGALQINLPSDGRPIGDWLVQAYDGASGQLLWQDRVDTGGGVDFEGAELPLGLAVLGGRLFVAGRTVDASGNWNFTVRAYRTSGQESEEPSDDVGEADACL